MVHPPRGAFENPNTTAYQRFLPTGPIAFLPLSPTHSSLVWSTRPNLAAALQAADPAVLAIMINAAFRMPHLSMKYLHQRILDAHATGTPISPEELRQEVQFRENSHAIEHTSTYSSLRNVESLQGIPSEDSEMVPPFVTELQPGTIASFPLKYNHAEAYLGEGQCARTALVGDAAHTIHPLAGQGLNLGLGDVESLANCIKTSVASGGDIGLFILSVQGICVYSLLQVHTPPSYLTPNPATSQTTPSCPQSINCTSSTQLKMTPSYGHDPSV